MAHTLTVLTLWLAQAIGLYALAAGIGLLLVPGRMSAIVADMEAHPAITYALGMAASAIGMAVLIPHHLTHDWLALLVTLLAACALVEGLMLIAAPALFFAIARPFLAAARLWAIVSIVLGAILFLAGLTGRADALP